MRRRANRHSSDAGNAPIISNGIEGIESIAQGTGDSNAGVDNGVGGDTINGIPAIDPSDIDAGGVDSGNTGRKRGRPRGSRNAGNTKATPKNLTETIAGSLHGIHMLIAGVSACPELMIDTDEASNLATAIRGVADQYTMSIDPRTIAWGNLLLVCGMVYGPRFVAIRQRQKTDKPAKARPAALPIRAEAPPAQKVNGPISPSQMFDAGDFNFGEQ